MGLEPNRNLLAAQENNPKSPLPPPPSAVGMLVGMDDIPTIGVKLANLATNPGRSVQEISKVAVAEFIVFPREKVSSKIFRSI